MNTAANRTNQNYALYQNSASLSVWGTWNETHVKETSVLDARFNVPHRQGPRAYYHKNQGCFGVDKFPADVVRYAVVRFVLLIPHLATKTLDSLFKNLALFVMRTKRHSNVVPMQQRLQCASLPSYRPRCEKMRKLSLVQTRFPAT